MDETIRLSREMALRIMRNRWQVQIVFVDDLNLVVKGPNKFLHLWVILLAYGVLGTPFSFHKFGGGLQADFIGYRLSYQSWTVGIAPKRVKWIVEWMESVESKGLLTTGRAFTELVGRLGFVARVLTWMKPFLSPLYAFNSVLGRGTCARLPEMAFISLQFVRSELQRACGQQPVRVKWGKPRGAFRSDAKCDQVRVVLGGWLCDGASCLLEAKWFSLELGPAEVPWLFNDKGESSWASTSAELLASHASVVAFGFLKPGVADLRDSLRVMVSAGTDNHSTPALQRKEITGKWPLMPLRMQVSTSLQQVGKKQILSCHPRDANSEADALTNGDFSSSNPSLRVNLQWCDFLKLVSSHPPTIKLTNKAFEQAQ